MAYPKYTINYTGDLVPPDQTANAEFKRITIGPHGYTLLPNAGVAIRIEASQEPAIDNTPNIKITISPQQ